MENEEEGRSVMEEVESLHQDIMKKYKINLAEHLRHNSLNIFFLTENSPHITNTEYSTESSMSAILEVSNRAKITVVVRGPVDIRI